MLRAPAPMRRCSNASATSCPPFPRRRASTMAQCLPDRKHPPVAMAPAHPRCAVQRPVHPHQPGEGVLAVRAILLAAEGIEHRLRTGCLVECEHGTATQFAVPLAAGPGAAEKRCAVERALHIDKPGDGLGPVRAILPAAKRIER